MTSTVSLLWWWGRLTSATQRWRIVPVTSTNGEESWPALSPDGTQVAFSWNKRNGSDLYVKHLGSEEALQLTEGDWSDTHPAWSPDGKFIAFVRRPPQALVGGSAVQVTTRHSLRPVPSPDGTFLYYADEYGLRRVSLGDGSDEAVYTYDASKAWGRNRMLAPTGIYMLDAEPGSRGVLSFLDLGTRRVSQIARFDRLPDSESRLAVAPDGTWLLAAFRDFVEIDIKVAEPMR